MSRELISSELFKLRTTRTFWGLLLAALVLTGLITGLIVLLDDPKTEDSVKATLTVWNVSGLFSMILGIICITGEYRHGTISSTLMVTPVRESVLTAKLLTGFLAGLAFGAACALLAALITAPWLANISAPIPSAGDVGLLTIGGLAYAALAGAFGLALGALVRNQVAAIVTILVFLFAVEPVLGNLVPAIEKFGPGGAAAALGGSTDYGSDLSMWQGGLVYLAYVALLFSAGTYLSSKTDIT